MWSLNLIWGDSIAWFRLFASVYSLDDREPGNLSSNYVYYSEKYTVFVLCLYDFREEL